MPAQVRILVPFISASHTRILTGLGGLSECNEHVPQTTIALESIVDEHDHALSLDYQAQLLGKALLNQLSD